jgi:hypothetical protein
LPSAGYLPTSLSRPVQEQVRALFGPGVDLRFCAVRPDYVPEVLQEAQHMERISLTRGLDDPARLEEVDVLVPGGQVGETPSEVAAFTGVARVFPNNRLTQEGVVAESALSFTVVARDRSASGWSWAAVGFGEAPQRLSVSGLAKASMHAAQVAFGAEPEEPAAEGAEEGATEGAARAETEEVIRRPNAEQDGIRQAASFTQRLVAEGRAALTRRARVIGAGEETDTLAARPLAADEDQPVAVWVDVDITDGLDTLSIHDSTTVRARATIFSRAPRPVLGDLRLTGAIRVEDVLVQGERKTIRTVVDAVVKVLDSDGVLRTMPLENFPLSWDLSPQQRRLTVGAGDPVAAVAAFSDTGTPRQILGEVLLRPTRPRQDLVGGVSPAGIAIGTFGAAAVGRPVASLRLDERADAMKAGSDGRALAESVIAIIGAELAAPDRDPSFPAYATERLLGGLTSAGGPTEVTATTDWVFFARRRTRICAGEPTTPTRTRTYRLFHRRQDDRVLTAVNQLRGGAAGGVRASDLGFDPVATLQFAEGEVTLRSAVADLRNSWLAADRGDEILLAGVGDFADSDGEAIALGRLATVRSAIADLADSTNADIQYLAVIPDEFHQAGLDGAMFTIGTSRQVETCVTVFRMFPDSLERLLAVLRQLGDSVPLEEAFLQGEVQAEGFTVRLLDDLVLDPDTVRVEWEGLRVLQGVVAVPSSTSEAELAQWRLRAGRVAEVIGLGGVDEERFNAPTTECGALLLVAVEPIIG